MFTPLAIDPVTPATLYAGTEGGVFKSTNGGANWSASQYRPDLNQCFVPWRLIRLTPATLYAGTWGGVFKSTNGGAGWQPAPAP